MIVYKFNQGVGNAVFLSSYANMEASIVNSSYSLGVSKFYTIFKLIFPVYNNPKDKRTKEYLEGLYG